MSDDAFKFSVGEAGQLFFFDVKMYRVGEIQPDMKVWFKIIRKSDRRMMGYTNQVDTSRLFSEREQKVRFVLSEPLMVYEGVEYELVPCQTYVEMKLLP